MYFNRRAKKRKLQDILLDNSESIDLNHETPNTLPNECLHTEELNGVSSCDEQVIEEQSATHDESRYLLKNPVIRLSRCDPLVEVILAKTAHVDKAPQLSTSTCAVTHVARRTPGKTPCKSPRSHHRKVSDKQPRHVHKRLMLEPSTPPVCNCSELLRRLQTNITDPPPLHLSDIELPSADTPYHCSSRFIQRFPKQEALYIVQSTASFDEAIVIDSDDSCEEDLQPEQLTEHTLSNQTLDADQLQNDSFQHNDDIQLPNELADTTDAEPPPFNVSIKVSLPLPNKLLTTVSPTPIPHQPRNSSKSRSRRSRLSLKRRRKKVVKAADQQISISSSEMVCVDSQHAETDISLNLSIDSVLHKDIEQLVEDEPQSNLDVSDSAKPDESLMTRSAYDEFDVLREEAQAAIDVEPLSPLLAKNQLPDQFIESVSSNAAADRVEEEEALQRSVISINNIAVEVEECTTPEKTLTDNDTTESYTYEISDGNVDVSVSEQCSAPTAVLLSELPPVSSDVNESEHSEVGPTLPFTSTDPDSSAVHFDFNTAPQRPRIKLHLSKKKNRSTVSLHRASKAIMKKAAKVKKSTLSRQRPGRKSRKCKKTRKRCIRASKRLKPQTDETAVLSSGVDDVRSTNTGREEMNLIPVENDILLQKYTEEKHILPSTEQDAATAAEAGPAHHETESTCPHVANLTEVYENLPGPSMTEAMSQVVTGKGAQLSDSLAHVDDTNLAELSVSSIEPMSSPSAFDWTKPTSHNRETLTYSEIALRNRLQGTPLADLLTNKNDRSLAVCMQLFSELQQCPDNQFRQRVSMLERLHQNWKYDQLIPMTRTSSETDSEDVALGIGPPQSPLEVNVIGRSPDSAYSTPMRENSTDEKSSATEHSGSNTVMSKDSATSSSHSSASVAKESSIASVTGASASDKLYPSVPQFLPAESCEHQSTSFQRLSVVVSATSESHQLPANRSWNSHLVAASASTTFVPLKDQTKPDNRCSDAKNAAAATFNSTDDYASATDNRESCDLSQSTGTTALEQDVESSKGHSAFRTVEPISPPSITDTAEISSVANHEEHSQWKDSTCNLQTEHTSAESLSASITGISLECENELSPQLYEIEPDSNNNLLLDSVQQLTGEKDNLDVSASLNVFANCSQTPLSSETLANDAFDTSQSKTNEDVSLGEIVTCMQRICGFATMADTTGVNEDNSKAVSASNQDTIEKLYPSMPASLFDLCQQESVFDFDIANQPQPLNQSSAVQQVSTEGITESQMLEPVVEMEQFLTGISSPDEHMITCDIDIPEVPLDQNYVTSSECPPATLQLKVTATGREVSAGIGGLAEPVPATETDMSGGSVCNETDNEPVSAICSEAEMICRDVSAQCLQQNTNVDGIDQSCWTADAVVRTASAYGPLDLTCNRVHSTSDAQRPTEVHSAVAVVSLAGQHDIAKTSVTYGNCAAAMNMCNCQSSSAAFSKYWSMVQVTNSYNMGWPPYPPHPCCGHPGPYPGGSHPAMFPGLHCSCHGVPQRRTRSRGGTRQRRRAAPSSCSRVDGIRSTKVAANGDSTQKTDGVPSTSNRSHSVSGIAGQDACSSSAEVIIRPSSTSSADAIVNVVTSDGGPPTQVDVSSGTQQSQCVVASSEANSTAISVKSRSRGGRSRRGGRNARNSAAVVAEQGDGSQPAVRGRKRGRPRKYPVDATTGRSSRNTAPDRHLFDDDGGFSSGILNVDDSTKPARANRRPRPPRSRQRKSQTAADLPVVGDTYQPSSTVVERTETCDLSTSTLPVDTSSGSTAAANYTAEHCHHYFPLMPPTSESMAYPIPCGPIVTSGAIIRKPRSRKQGCRTGSTSSTSEKDALGGASTAVSGADSSSGNQPVSWQPLTTDAAISSLLDTLSVAVSDRDVQETTLTPSDTRLQTGAAIPLVMLERADLNRLLGGESAEDGYEVTAVDVCGLGAEESGTEQQINDMIDAMASLPDDTQQTTTTTTTTTTESMYSVGSGESAAAVCSTLMDSDVGQALDAALQNGIDDLLSSISDDQSSTVTVTSEKSAADCILTASVLPAMVSGTDQQHYVLYSAQTEELIDTLLRSTHEAEVAEPGEMERELPGELHEMQAVQLSAEDWQAEAMGDDAQMGGEGMLVEFDPSLLTIIELGHDHTSVDGAACVALAPGAEVGQVVSGETMAWNIFQGLEVSQFQVVASDQPTEAPPASEHAVVDDSLQTVVPADGSEPDESAHLTSSDSNAVDDAGGPDNVPTAEAKTDTEKPSSVAASTDGSDDEYVLIVDCVDGINDRDEVDYEIVDESEKTTARSPDSADQSEDGIRNPSDHPATNS